MVHTRQQQAAQGSSSQNPSLQGPSSQGQAQDQGQVQGPGQVPGQVPNPVAQHVDHPMDGTLGNDLMQLTLDPPTGVVPPIAGNLPPTTGTVPPTNGYLPATTGMVPTQVAQPSVLAIDRVTDNHRVPFESQVSPGSAGTAAPTFGSYQSGISSSNPVVVQQAHKWEYPKWDLGSNFMAHLDVFVRHIKSLALTRDQAINLFLDSLAPPMQEYARLGETSTSTWEDLAAHLKSQFHAPDDATGWKALIATMKQGHDTQMQFVGKLMKVHREWAPHLEHDDLEQLGKDCVMALLIRGSKKLTKACAEFKDKKPNAKWSEYVAHLAQKARTQAHLNALGHGDNPPSSSQVNLIGNGEARRERTRSGDDYERKAPFKKVGFQEPPPETRDRYQTTPYSEKRDVYRGSPSPGPSDSYRGKQPPPVDDYRRPTCRYHPSCNEPRCSFYHPGGHAGNSKRRYDPYKRPGNQRGSIPCKLCGQLGHAAQGCRN